MTAARHTLQQLRQAAWLARAVLLGLLLSMGAALVAPIAQPQSLEMICSGAGTIKFIAFTDEGPQESAASPMDCPICQSVGAPPPVHRFSLASPPALSQRPFALPAPIAMRRSAAPLPARGPPLSS